VGRRGCTALALRSAINYIRLRTFSSPRRRPPPCSPGTTPFLPLPLFIRISTQAPRTGRNDKSTTPIAMKSFHDISPNNDCVCCCWRCSTARLANPDSNFAAVVPKFVSRFSLYSPTLHAQTRVVRVPMPILHPRTAIAPRQTFSSRTGFG
jgi:hypothetical protein